LIYIKRMPTFEILYRIYKDIFKNLKIQQTSTYYKYSQKSD